MLTVKVLGLGCDNCRKVESVARRAIGNLAIDAEVIKVTDVDEMKMYPILATPGLVVNEKLVCGGRIPDEGEVVTWLVEALEAT
jgi:small redox-active disulfide protein 2